MLQLKQSHCHREKILLGNQDIYTISVVFNQLQLHLEIKSSLIYKNTIKKTSVCLLYAICRLDHYEQFMVLPTENFVKVTGRVCQTLTCLEVKAL